MGDGDGGGGCGCVLSQLRWRKSGRSGRESRPGSKTRLISDYCKVTMRWTRQISDPRPSNVAILWNIQFIIINSIILEAIHL